MKIPLLNSKVVGSGALLSAICTYWYFTKDEIQNNFDYKQQ